MVSDDLITLDAVRTALCRSSWIQIMDLAACYSLPLEQRVARGWAALCHTDPADPRRLRYTAVDGQVHYYGRDIEYARIDPVAARPRIELLPPRFGPPRLEEVFVDGDFAVRYAPDTYSRDVSPFAPGGRYQVNERYQDFDRSVLLDVDSHPAAHESWLRRMLDPAPLRDVAGNRSGPPPARDELIGIFAELAVPMLFLQGPPGTGKTTFLADLVARLIEDGIDPSEITCLAQTRRAAAEIHAKLVETAEGPGALDRGRLPPSPGARIADCTSTVYVGTIHKNPEGTRSAARLHPRPIVLIDEASQIEIPLLLYALRYATPDAVVRFFGDGLQLSPTNAYLRDPEILPKGGLAQIVERTMRLNPDGVVFLDRIVRTLGAEAAGQDSAACPAFLRGLVRDQTRSPVNQSIFTFPVRLAEIHGESPQARALAGRYAGFTFVLQEGYRQEPTLHGRTSRIFYEGHATLRCAFPQAETNLDEARALVRAEPAAAPGDSPLRHLCRDVGRGLRALFSSGLNWMRNLARRFIAAHREADEEKRNFDVPVAPLTGRAIAADEVAAAYLELPAARDLLRRARVDISADWITGSLLPALGKRTVFIRHGGDRRAHPSAHTSLIEVWLTVLIVRILETERFRTRYGIGVVTPFRAQEQEIYRHYARCFPSLPRVGDRGWLGTPERFQGRDISRGVLSLVTSGDDVYLEPASMFTPNKLNVATSRAGSQQVILGHRDLFSEKTLRRYRAAIEGREEPDRTIVRATALRYREKLIEYYNDRHHDADFADIELG